MPKYSELLFMVCDLSSVFWAFYRNQSEFNLANEKNFSRFSYQGFVKLSNTTRSISFTGTWLNTSVDK